jgi:hypothetical protein
VLITESTDKSGAPNIGWASPLIVLIIKSNCTAMHALMEQDAKDTLFEISESQAGHELWSQIRLTDRTRLRNNTTIHKPSRKKENRRKSRVDTDYSLTSRDVALLPKAPDQFKVGKVVCYDTLKILDECRPVFSQRTQPVFKTARTNVLSRSKQYSANSTNSTGIILLPNVNDYSSEERTLKARILENALVNRKGQWEKQPDIKASYYKKFSKYSSSVLKHEHWGDFVMHLPSVVESAVKTNPFR